MDEKKYTVGNLIDDLEKLRDLKIESEPSLAAWYEFANEIEEKIYLFNLHNEIPEFIIHYLSDVDIRLKDISYRRSQDAELARIMIDLNNKVRRSSL